jgi:hypothetical protein
MKEDLRCIQKHYIHTESHTPPPPAPTVTKFSRNIQRTVVAVHSLGKLVRFNARAFRKCTRDKTFCDCDYLIILCMCRGCNDA